MLFRSFVSAGGGSIPYRAGSGLHLHAGSGIDTFAVKASPNVPYFVDGGEPSALPGDTLTYEAEGRATSGDATPPDGRIESPGVQPVVFGSIEALTILP